MVAGFSVFSFGDCDFLNTGVESGGVFFVFVWIQFRTTTYLSLPLYKSKHIVEIVLWKFLPLSVRL